MIGLDLSLSSTGVAVPGRTFTIEGKGRGPERLSGFRRALLRTFKDADVDLLVLEGYAFQKSDAGARSIAELGGVARLLAYDLGIPYVEVPPSTLKLFATGNGGPKTTKDVMLAAAQRDDPFFAGKTYDEADAHWLRQVGLVIVGKRKPTDYQRRALLKVVVPQGIRRLVSLAGAPA